MTVSAGGAQVTLQAAASAPLGQFQMNLSGQAGTATYNSQVAITVTNTPPPAFYFLGGQFGEIAVPIGGSANYTFLTGVDSPPTYTVTMSVVGLPAGTTATFSPSTITPGQSGTVTITAASNAGSAQNLTITLLGTPSVSTVASAGLSVLLDVTPPPGHLSNNRTAYVSTEGTPYWAAYDSLHQLVFSSNHSWNRLDVISATTHQILKSIPIWDPRGVDMATDNSRVWVTTGSQQVFEIDPVSLSVVRHELPNDAQLSNLAPQTWEGNLIYALSDGTVLLNFSHATGDGSQILAIWNPTTNALTSLPTPSSAMGTPMPGIIMKSGDGSRVYSISGDSSGSSYYYDVATSSVSNVITLAGYAVAAAADLHASHVAVYDASGLNMYDGNLTPLGPLPGGGLADFLLQGGMVFSPTNGNLYEVCQPAFSPLIMTINSQTLNVLGIAPAMPMIPVMTEMSNGFDVALPIAVDSTGMVIGVQDYGIVFDDSAFYENLVPNQPGTPVYLQHMSPYFGPLSGGTSSGGFGNSFDLTPDVWYGPNRGKASLGNGGVLTITSPPTTVPGPVDIKIFFPDGIEVYDPLFFSYGPDVQYNYFSGSGPNGDVAGRIAGFGMPLDGSGGTLTVGGTAADITTVQTQYLPFTGSPFPNTYLNFVIPPGSPGWANVTVQTPDGSSTLPRSHFYAKSVMDYLSADKFNAVLFDPVREQLYLSTTGQIDVFSLTSSQFQTPITPPAQGASKQFAGMALTPDGNSLIAADITDGSIAVIDLNNPSSSTLIPVAPLNTLDTPCILGPSYVAATSTNLAFVSYGGLPGPGCGAYGPTYLIDLVAETSIQLPYDPNCSGLSGPTLYGAGFVSASHDGTKVALGGGVGAPGGFCIYDAVQKSYTQLATYQLSGAAISGDGNVAASDNQLIDSTSHLIGRIALPDIYYLSFNLSVPGIYPLFEPQINDAGSLYFMAYSDFFDIIDFQHGQLRMRFSLAETLPNVVAPMALDSSGQRVFLITSTGLTVIDLGEAPLSIGSLSVSQAAPGTQITLRGSGFNSSTTATIGGQPASVTFVDSETLQVTVPVLSSGPADLVLTNLDGTVYTLNSAVTIP
ncbi:MAG TPA: IPT/TIG domain-containing protein [Candidatus Acidoferrum sp.]|nr:IPT/TIG domain-containing protein [Candidatus Acidoferrum sp.]